MTNINFTQALSRFLKMDFPKNDVDTVAQRLANLAAFVPTDSLAQKQVAAPRSPVVNNEAPLAQSQLAQLNNVEKTALLKELINLPKDIKDFLVMMTAESQTEILNNEQLANTLLANNLDLSKVAVFIQQNGKEAVTKIFQLIANFNQMGVRTNISELSEMTAIINACIPTADAPQLQTLKNIMLLYLPWLPLGEQNSFNLEIGKKSNGDEEEISDDSVTILIATENFGNVQVVLFKSGKEAINIQISCSKEFPKEEVEKALMLESKDYNIHTGIAFDEKENLSKEKKEYSKTQVSLNTSPGVNPFLILMAHSVIKIIIGIDKSDSLRQNRYKMLEETNGKS